MKITIEGKEKEIADFILAVQNRQLQKMSFENFKNCYEDFKKKSNRGKF